MLLTSASRITIAPSPKVQNTITTNEIVPSAISFGFFLRLWVDIDPADLSNPDFAITQLLEASKDGQTWFPVASATWYGDPDTVDLGVPGLGFEVSRLVGYHVRGTISVPALPKAANRHPADKRTAPSAVHAGLILEITD